MRRDVAGRILTLGGMTGVRSMTGLRTLAAARGGVPRAALSAAVIAEMIADKTAVLGNRTDPLPLAGRAAIGALVGAIIAHQHDRSLVAGATLGSVAAVAAAHLAYQVRTRLVPGAAGGLLEDALLVAVASRYAARNEPVASRRRDGRLTRRGCRAAR